MAELAQVLRHVEGIGDPNVLVDAATRDDAAVYRIAPDRAIVATVDFFTPIVDDPRAWGAIAAANSLSDIYAMGARPLFVLNLVGWPREKLPFSLLGEVISGAQEVVTKAGCLVLGGHSIDDPEPKFGMVAIGEVHPDKMLTNAGARPGDRIVLTKPLGNGILATALKRGLIGEPEMARAVEVMVTLNDTAARAALGNGATSATDVTGFGLIGHLHNILRSSQVGAILDVDSLPILEGTREQVARGAVPGGTKRNLEAVAIEWGSDVTEVERLICADAQTSGGLLITVPEKRVSRLLDDLKAAGAPAASVIGKITADHVFRIGRGPVD